MLLTPLFAVFFTVFYVLLSLNVIKNRFANNISLGSKKGSEENRQMEVAIRSHANFIEYVPLALILFYFIEMLSMSSHAVFYLGCSLFVGRVMHFLGMNNPKKMMILRKLGMVITLLVLLISSVLLALRYIPFSV